MNYLQLKLKGVKNRIKTACFTLIELLVVISIIAVLAGLLLTAVSSVRAKGKITKAKSEANAIVMAIKSYESTYGLLPVIDGQEKIGHSAKVNEYDGLMEFLTQVDITTGSPSVDKSQGNLRKVIFLDVPNNFATSSYLDPWGSRYIILMDENYDNQVTNPDGGTALNGSVFVYSYGLDKNDDGGNSTGKDQDDVATWK